MTFKKRHNTQHQVEHVTLSTVEVSKCVRKSIRRISFAFVILLSFTSFTSKPKVNWLTFEKLETALAQEPKKVIIHFYADWCAYCKKMEDAVYTKPAIVETLNNNYYAVKFNVESKDTIQFGGKEFVNRNLGKRRNAYHEIPEFLAGRKGKTLALPATVILDENFNIEKRFYRYISPKEMLKILKQP